MSKDNHHTFAKNYCERKSIDEIFYGQIKNFFERILNFRGFKDKMAVEKLLENDDFVIVNKPYDMYINSNNENEKVSKALYS